MASRRLEANFYGLGLGLGLGNYGLGLGTYGLGLGTCGLGLGLEGPGLGFESCINNFLPIFFVLFSCKTLSLSPFDYEVFW